MKISPQVEFALKVLLVILSALASGSAYRPSFISVDVAKDVAGMSSTALLILTGIYTLLGTGAVPSVTAAGKVAAWFFVVGLGALLVLGNAHQAVASPKLPIPLPPLKPLGSLFDGKGILTGKPVADVDKVFLAIQAMSLADLQAAKADADATKDALASSCYAPLIDLVQAQQSVDMSKLSDNNPHLILLFQRNRDLYNALRPGSPVSVGCAPLAEQVKLDIVTLIGAIAGGTISMASFGL